jgi:predicted ATP-dependent Lon-type protease
MTRNNADEIIPRIWLGNVRASTDQDFIKKNNIQVVFNCTKDLPFSPLIPIKYRVPVDDNLREEEIRNLELWSPEITHKLVTEYRKGNNILVHCMAGMQRSAACVAFLLIAVEGMHGLDAMQFIKQRRPIAFHPNANFGRSIDYFDREFHSNILPVLRRNQGKW